MEVQVVKTTVKAAAGVKETNYAAIINKYCRQIGFITDDGIYLELYEPKPKRVWFWGFFEKKKKRCQTV